MSTKEKNIFHRQLAMSLNWEGGFSMPLGIHPIPLDGRNRKKGAKPGGFSSGFISPHFLAAFQTRNHSLLVKALFFLRLPGNHILVFSSDTDTGLDLYYWRDPGLRPQMTVQSSPLPGGLAQPLTLHPLSRPRTPQCLSLAVSSPSSLIHLSA